MVTKSFDPLSLFKNKTTTTKIYTTVHIWRSEDNLREKFVPSRNPTQVIRQQAPSLMSHLTDPIVIFVNITGSSNEIDNHSSPNFHLCYTK